MKLIRFRIIFGILLIIPLALGIFLAANPLSDIDHPFLSLVFYVIGVPIIVLNAWAWDAPQIIQKLLGKEI